MRASSCWSRLTELRWQLSQPSQLITAQVPHTVNPAGAAHVARVREPSEDTQPRRAEAKSSKSKVN